MLFTPIDTLPVMLPVLVNVLPAADVSNATRPCTLPLLVMFTVEPPYTPTTGVSARLMPPYNGYAKAITGERMRRWHRLQIGKVLPSLLRDWVSEMDCTSKAIRNMLTPLRSLFEDAVNDELIDFNPF